MPEDALPSLTICKKFDFGILNCSGSGELESRLIQIGFGNECVLGGIQMGFANSAPSASFPYVVQGGIANAIGSFENAFQLGLVNFANLESDSSSNLIQGGLLFNYCSSQTRGLQVGLINYRAGGKWYSKIFPFFSVRTGRSKKI